MLDSVLYLVFLCYLVFAVATHSIATEEEPVNKETKHDR